MVNRSWPVDSLTYATYHFALIPPTYRSAAGSWCPAHKSGDPSSPSKEFSAVTVMSLPSLHTILSRPVPGVPGHPVLQHLDTWTPSDGGQQQEGAGRGDRVKGRGQGCPFHCCCQIHSPVKRRSSDDTDKNTLAHVLRKCCQE